MSRRDEFFTLFREVLVEAAYLWVADGDRVPNCHQLLATTSYSKREASWRDRQMSPRDFGQYIDFLRVARVHKTHWGNQKMTESRSLISPDKDRDLTAAFNAMRDERAPPKCGSSDFGQSIDKIGKINAARAVPFATTESGTIHSIDDFITFIREEIGGLRAAGKHQTALGIGKSARQVLLHKRCPWQGEKDRFQAIAALAGLGHWTAHQAGALYIRERAKYLEMKDWMGYDDPFFYSLGLSALTYDNPLDNDAPYDLLDIFYAKVESQVLTYPFLGACCFAEAASYAIRRGVPPDDTSERRLHGASPSQLLERAITLNLNKNRIEDAVTEVQVLAEGYAGVANFDKAVKQIQRAEKILGGYEEVLKFRQHRLACAARNVYEKLFANTNNPKDLELLYQSIEIVKAIEKYKTT